MVDEPPAPKKESEPKKESRAKKELKPKKDLNPKEVRTVLHNSTVSKPNHRGRGRTQAEIKEAYAKYNQLKKKVVELEKENHRFLILFPASDADINEQNKFYNMGGNSAIIYCHEIGPRIKRTPTLRRDMDNGNDNEKFHSGICSIADLSKLEQRLAEIGIKRVKSKYEKLVIFELHREYPQSEIKEMLREEQKKLDGLNKLIYSKVLFPDVHRQVLELKKLVPSKVKNMDKTYRQVVGMKLIDSLINLIQFYSQMAHGDREQKEAGRLMMLELDSMLALISMLNELKLWEVSTCIRAATIIVSLKKLLRGKVINK